MSDDLPIRLPKSRESGEAFIDWLARRTTRQQRQRLTSFLQEWDHLRDELQGEPVTVAEYAKRWNVTRATAYRLLEEFREAMPTEDTPDRLLDLLWDGVPHSTGREVAMPPMKWILAVEVVER